LQRRKTVVHVVRDGQEGTAPAAALAGLLTCRSYFAAAERTVIIGPWRAAGEAPERLLGPGGEVLYCTRAGRTDHRYAQVFAEIERKFDVALLYGRRYLANPQAQLKAAAEVALLDVSQANVNPVHALKAWLFEEFGLDSLRHEGQPEYETALRLAPAALAVLRALGASDPSHPAVLVAHDASALPTALAAILDPLQTFKTLYFAHDLPTIRRLIEQHPGHDTLFFNACRWADGKPVYLPEFFGPQDDGYEYMLAQAAQHCDHVLGLGWHAAAEFRFLHPGFQHLTIDTAYDGLVARELSLGQKRPHRQHVQEALGACLGYRPDFILVHASGPGTRSGFWRDLRVLEHLDEPLRLEGRTAVLVFLDAAEAGQGNPALPAERTAFLTALQACNSRCRNVQAVPLCLLGESAPPAAEPVAAAQLTRTDFQLAADVEFNQSIYDPCGLPPLASLGAGAISVISSACGCRDLIGGLSGFRGAPNVIVADYTQLGQPAERLSLEELLAIDRAFRDRIEQRVAAQAAQELFGRLARDDRQREQLLGSGYQLAAQMDWNQLCQRHFVPALECAYRKYRVRQIA